MPDLISISLGGRILTPVPLERDGESSAFGAGDCCCTSAPLPVLCVWVCVGAELASKAELRGRFVRQPSAFARLYCTASVANEMYSLQNCIA